MRVVLDVEVEVDDVAAARAYGLMPSTDGETIGISSTTDEQAVARALETALFIGITNGLPPQSGLAFRGALPSQVRVPDHDGSYPEHVLPPLPAIPEGA